MKKKIVLVGHFDWKRERRRWMGREHATVVGQAQQKTYFETQPVWPDWVKIRHFREIF